LVLQPVALGAGGVVGLIAHHLRGAGKRVLLAVNKAEGIRGV
jgi:hypothetical protein